MVEKTTRRHLDTGNLSALQGRDINKLVIDAIFKDNQIIKHWEELTRSIPGRCEDYSMELLKVVCQTWITVRAHSFAEGCNSIFHKCFERGTRKTLKKSGTEKAA